MRVEFAYAQARAQARHGDRLTPASWRLLESSDGLAQYLHAVRGTALAPRVQHFTAASSPHAIERSLRRDWRAAVDDASHWAPAVWRESIVWTAWLSDLPAIAYLKAGGKALPWMQVDPVLSAFAVTGAEARRLAIDESAFAAATDADSEDSLIRWWTTRWQTLWPASESDHAALRDLVALVRKQRKALEDPSHGVEAARDLEKNLAHQVVRLMRTRVRQPAIIYCHLVLTGLELWRLRRGLIRRALFNDLLAERGP